MIAIPVQRIYLVWMIKSKTGAFLESCKWAHDKFTWRDVKYVINGRSGGAGTSVVDDGCFDVELRGVKGKKKRKKVNIMSWSGSRWKCLILSISSSFVCLSHSSQFTQQSSQTPLISEQNPTYLESIDRLLTLDCVGRLLYNYTLHYQTIVLWWKINYNYQLTSLSMRRKRKICRVVRFRDLDEEFVEYTYSIILHQWHSIIYIFGYDFCSLFPCECVNQRALIDSGTWDRQISSSSWCDCFQWNIFFILKMTRVRKKKDGTEKKLSFLLLSVWQGNNLVLFSCFGSFSISFSLSLCVSMFFFTMWVSCMVKKFFFYEFHQPSHQQVSQCEIHYFSTQELHFFLFLLPTPLIAMAKDLVTFKNIKIIWEDWDALKRQKNLNFLLLLFLMLLLLGKLMKVRDCFLSDSSDFLWIFMLLVPEIISFFPFFFWSL